MTEFPNHALIVCDLQTVALNALPETPRRALLDFIRMVLEAVTACPSGKSKIVWSGLRFSSGYYDEVPDRHKVFGALKRLSRMTGGTSKFFVQGDSQTQFALKSDANTTRRTGGDVGDSILWRNSHLPPSPTEWQRCLGDSVTDVTVVGIRTAYSVQATVQALCDLGYNVTVIKECILDDDKERHKAVLEQLLPIYADVVSLSDWMELHAAPNIVNGSSPGRRLVDLDPTLRYFCDCGRGGHSFLYQQHLVLFRDGWARYPLQQWFTDSLSGKSYQCPLGKRVIDFCDEPQFSRCSMYVKGREWLDEKEKLWDLAPDLMPTTYVVQNRSWKGVDHPPAPSQIGLEDGPYFVKECMKNGGKAVKVADTVDAALSLVDTDSMFVIQGHVRDPWLTINNQKCHVKSYFLLVEDHEGLWQLRMYPEAFLSVSPNKWSPNDLSAETQITIKRTTRLYKDRGCPQWEGWPSSYSLVKNVVCEVVKRAVVQGKLKSRNQDAKEDATAPTTTTTTARQFEIFSADVIVDTSAKAWLIECNFGCVLFDPKIGQPLTTIGLRTYQSLYEVEGDKVEINDHRMLADTVGLIFDGTPEEEIKWELVGSYGLGETQGVDPEG